MGERGTTEHLGAQTPLKCLYPAVNQLETPLPTCWNYKDKNQSIALVPNQLTVQYKGGFQCVAVFGDKKGWVTLLRCGMWPLSTLRGHCFVK